MGATQGCCDSAANCMSSQTPDVANMDDAIPISGGDGLSEQAFQKAVRATGHYRVRLNKNESRRLGIDVEHAEDSAILPIVAITGGAAEAWNRANPQRIIRAGDAVVEVNGYRGNAVELLAACKRDAILDMTVQREAVPAMVRRQDQYLPNPDGSCCTRPPQAEERHAPCSCMSSW